MTSDPSKWLGLLNWSTRYHDGTAASNPRQLTAEERAWLEEALEAGVVDETKLLISLVEVLTLSAASETVDSDKINEITEQLEDIVCQIDRAQDLCKLGKLPDVAAMLHSSHEVIRAAGCRLVAACAQNNPYVQECCLDPTTAIIQSVTHMLVHDPSPTVTLKALGALSCITRNFQPAERLFVEEGDGMLVLTHIVTTPHTDSLSLRKRRKALHLLRHLLASSEAARAHILTASPGSTHPLLETIVDLMGGFCLVTESEATGEGLDHDVDSAETVLHVLASLLKTDPTEFRPALQACDLAGKLSARMKDVNMLPPSMRDQAQEERLLIAQLAGLLAGVSETPAQAPAPAASVPTSLPPKSSVFSHVGERAAPNVFVPTKEFQNVLPGQSIPPGLHVRLNMTTGQREAKLLDPEESDEGKKAQMVVVDENGDAKTVVHTPE